MAASNQSLESAQKTLNELQESLKKVTTQIELTRANLDQLQEEDRIGDALFENASESIYMAVEVGPNGPFGPGADPFSLLSASGGNGTDSRSVLPRGKTTTW